MTDTIEINKLSVFGRHGVLAEETALGQRFVYHIKCNTDFTDCAAQDNVDYTVNYAEVCDLVVEISGRTNYRLIETLADKIANGILDRFPRVSAVAVTVTKPSAPIPYIFESVAVTTKRSRNA